MINELIKDCEIVIFDFDGTLLNTEPYHQIAHGKVLSEALGREIVLTHQDFQKVMGKRNCDVYEIFKNEYGIKTDKDILINKQEKEAIQLIFNSNEQIFGYFYQILKYKGNKKFYILSNNNDDVIIPILKKFNIFQHFEHVWSMLKMKLTKQYVFEHLNEFIDAHDKKIALFEDSNTTLEIGKSFGYVCIGIESEINKGKIQTADYIIKV